jgi:ribosomal protein S18 acetylase RimI-like enzyme
VIRALAESDFDLVHRTFVEAFSDYVLPMAIAAEQLREMLTRRAWVPEASIAVFEGERMVAFTLNGIEGPRGYDSGTGVVPSHRRHGLGRRVMEESFRVLREHGVREYVLEVIDANVKAAELYRSLGFSEVRGLQCWRYESQSLRAAESQSVGTWPRGRSAALRLDVLPSWQNTPSSIARARDPHVVLGDGRGHVVLFPSNGDVPLLFVEPEERRKGRGTRLLEAAAGVAGKPLRIMNVDERDAGIAAFLERAGAQRTVRQLEMIRAI